MRLMYLPALLGIAAAAACADSTAPISEPKLAAVQPQDAAMNHTAGGAGSGAGSVTVVAPKPVTLPFSTIDCNGEVVTGTSTHYALAVAAAGQQGTFNLTGVFDQINAVGQPSGVTYFGSNLAITASVLSPGATVFFTDQDFDLRPRAKGLKDTYLDIVSVFVSTPDGPVLSNVSFTTKCQKGERGSGTWTRSHS